MILSPDRPTEIFAALGLARLLIARDYALRIGFVPVLGVGVHLTVCGRWPRGFACALDAALRALASTPITCDPDGGVRVGRLQVGAAGDSLVQAQAALREALPSAEALFTSPAATLLSAIGRACWSPVARDGRYSYWLWRPAVGLPEVGAALRGERRDLAIGAWSFAEGDCRARAELAWPEAGR